jgi:hypothetical protein
MVGSGFRGELLTINVWLGTWVKFFVGMSSFLKKIKIKAFWHIGIFLKYILNGLKKNFKRES